MTTYIVHFTAIEWDGDPRDYPEAANLPSEYTIEVEASDESEAFDIAAERMSDNTGFLYRGAEADVRRVG
jgi:hypothetical protein